MHFLDVKTLTFSSINETLFQCHILAFRKIESNQILNFAVPKSVAFAK